MVRIPERVRAAVVPMKVNDDLLRARLALAVRRLFGTLLVSLLNAVAVPAYGAAFPQPPDVVMNPDAGRGGLIILNIRLEDGEALPLILDTGSPGTFFDKSVASRLGRKHAVMPMRSLSAQQNASIYAAPKIYLGSVRLATANKVGVVDLSKFAPHLNLGIKGILGIDSLRNYCIQMDFQSRLVRFLDSARLDTATLGNSYHLTFLTNSGVPMIQHAGLFGGPVTGVIVDTGNNSDGMVQGRDIRHNSKGSYSGGLIRRTKHFLVVQGWVHASVGSLKCVWDGNTYTNLSVGRGPRDYPNWIGLRFLARHLVTFDFPNATMYLKQTSSVPLNEPLKANGVMEEYREHSEK